MSHQSVGVNKSHAVAETVSPATGHAASVAGASVPPYVAGGDISQSNAGVWPPAPAVRPHPLPVGHAIVIDPLTNAPASYIPRHYSEHAHLQSAEIATVPPQSFFSHGTPVTVDGVSLGTPYTIMYLPTKKGHRLLGLCCDMRRATILVNAASLAFGVLALMDLTIMLRYSNFDYRFGDTMYFYEDFFQDVYEYEEFLSRIDASAFSTKSIILSMLYVLFRMICEGLGIYGASTYRQWMVGVALAGYIIDVLACFVRWNDFGVIWAAFCVYPHVMLIYEIRKGIMTQHACSIENH
jgi:hypothetical protein